MLLTVSPKRVNPYAEMTNLPKFRTLLTSAMLMVLLAACDSNPVGPLEPANRTLELKEGLETFQSAPAGTLNLDRGSAIVASGRDTVVTGG